MNLKTIKDILEYRDYIFYNENEISNNEDIAKIIFNKKFQKFNKQKVEFIVLIDYFIDGLENVVASFNDNDPEPKEDIIKIKKLKKLRKYLLNG